MWEANYFLSLIGFTFFMGGLFGPLSPLGTAALVKGDSGFGPLFAII